MGEMMKLKAHDGSGSFEAYCAKPESGRGPAIVVIQEIFGVNADIRHIADSWAKEGYFAIAPDLFWRQEPGIQLTDKSEGEWAKAFELYKGFNVDKGMEDIEETIRAARGMDGANGKVGCVGFCLGGLLAYLAATRTDSDASVGYYGVGIHERLNESHAIAKPLLLHIAMEDGFVDKDAQRQMHEGLDGHPKVKLYDYPGCDHAFARTNGQHRNDEAADLAHQRTRDFFATYLKS